MICPKINLLLNHYSTSCDCSKPCKCEFNQVLHYSKAYIPYLSGKSRIRFIDEELAEILIKYQFRWSFEKGQPFKPYRQTSIKIENLENSLITLISRPLFCLRIDSPHGVTLGSEGSKIIRTQLMLQAFYKALPTLETKFIF